MSGKCFLDTNIFIYSLDRQSPAKAGIAFGLIREHTLGGTGVISFQVVQEFFSVVIRRSPEMLQAGGGEAFLTSVLRPLLSVHSSAALYGEALTIHARYKLSWYDSLIVAAACEARCSVLYSEDLQHGRKINAVRIENPFLTS